MGSHSAYSVECFGLKPYGLSKISLFSLNYVDNCVKMIFSITLEREREREGDMDSERDM